MGIVILNKVIECAKKFFLVVLDYLFNPLFGLTIIKLRIICCDIHKLHVAEGLLLSYIVKGKLLLKIYIGNYINRIVYVQLKTILFVTYVVYC